MKKPVMLVVIIAGLLSGCGADSGWKVAYEQEKALRDQQEARIRNLETRQQQQQPQQTTPQQERALTRAESIEYCQSLDRAKDVPFLVGLSHLTMVSKSCLLFSRMSELRNGGGFHLL